MNWRKSAHCVEDSGCIAAGTWRKSTYSSMASSDGCIGAGTGLGVVGVKDTTLGDASPVLEFSTSAWKSFTLSLAAV